MLVMCSVLFQLHVLWYVVCAYSIKRYGSTF